MLPRDESKGCLPSESAGYRSGEAAVSAGSTTASPERQDRVLAVRSQSSVNGTIQHTQPGVDQPFFCSTFPFISDITVLLRNYLLIKLHLDFIYFLLEKNMIIVVNIDMRSTGR